MRISVMINVFTLKMAHWENFGFGVLTFINLILLTDSCMDPTITCQTMFKIPGCQNATSNPEWILEQFAGLKHIDCIGNCARNTTCRGVYIQHNTKSCILIKQQYDIYCEHFNTSDVSEDVYYDKKKCMNNGTLLQDNSCNCPTSFSGENCEQRLEIINPCVNGGTLTAGGCNCTYPYDGVICDKINLCYNGGTEIDNAWCACLPGFCGELCDKIENESPPCSNEGCRVSGVCQCTRGYHGAQCDNIILDCKEGFDLGSWPGINAVFVVKPRPDYTHFKIRCNMGADGNSILQTRNVAYDYVSYARNWTEYEDGFGDLDGNYWIGLKKIYYLSLIRLTCSLYVLRNGNMRQYPSFTMLDPISGYEININAAGGWNNGLSDIMQTSNGQRFSTYDVGNTDCAQSEGSVGWWYNSPPGCTMCNLNGPMSTDSQPAQCDGQSITSTYIWFYYP